ncbi:MAG: nitrite reductase small subunit NirD [Betaproteobacteria bacterium]|nr:nitrite reductase small subunit NirD [Betaproteobacteria bacterium]
MSEWLKICPLEDIPRLGARVVRTAQGDVAVFRNAEDELFALADQCPHRGGPLSQGIVFDRRVSCALHGLTLNLDSGAAQAPDDGCAKKYRVRLDKGVVFLNLGA